MKIVFVALLAIQTTALRLDSKGVNLAVSGTSSASQQLQSESDSAWAQIEAYMKTLKPKLTAADMVKDPKLPENQILFDILKELKPCAKCSAPKRYGEANDGGYAMCSELLENSKTTAGYSIGINGYDGWGKDVSTKLKIPIYQFDCTDARRPQCPGCDFHFYDLCITASQNRAQNTSQFKTIQELMALNGHGKRGNVRDLVMQIDVEAYEWELFADPNTADAMQEFSQISIELHDIFDMIPKYSKNFKVSMETRLKALQNLNKQFVVAHVHGNNARPKQSIGDYSVPSLLEVLYVRRDTIPVQEQCNSNPEYLPEDARNVPKIPDVDPPRLP